MSAPLQVISYPARLVSKIPLPYVLSFILLWELEFITDYVVLMRFPQTGDSIAPHFGLLLFYASVCINIIYCSHVLIRLYPDLQIFIDHDQEEVRTWYEKKLRWCLQGVWPLLFGFTFAVLEELTLGNSVQTFLPPEEKFLWALFIGYRSAGFFFIGVGVWALFNVALIPLQITRFKLKVSLNQVSGLGLLGLGSAYFKIALAITVSYVIGLISVIVSPISESKDVLVWEILGAVIIFSFFIFPQIGIHRIMADEKRRQLLTLSGHMESALTKSVSDPSSENMGRLKELLELQYHIKSMSEWPFDTNTLWQLVSALLIPLGLAVLESVFGGR